jgi:hypothetical protein
MTVAHLLAVTSSAELTEWMAFLRVEDEDAEERRTGQKVWKPDN